MAEHESAAAPPSDATRLVWDLPLRLFHWLLALSIFGSWLTAELEEMQIHFWLGYWIIGLLVFRIIWGVAGPRHARFTSFAPRPGALVRYVKDLAKGAAAQSVGHNPLGSLSVFALLLFVGAQAVTGLFTTDDIIWSGPYFPSLDGDTSDALSTFHRTNFNWILALVILHVLAIAFYWIVKKQNLVRPMITGRKPADVVPEKEAIAGSQLVKALIVIAVAAGLVYLLIANAPPPPEFSF